MDHNWLVSSALGICALLAAIALWKVPQWQVGRVKDLAPKERFDRVNEARKTLATIIGGAAVLAGGYVTWQNLELAREGQTATLKNIELAREGQIADRYSKAIEQLGTPDSNEEKKIEVRLGGIYALESIANESKDLHWPIIEVLSAYVRNHAPNDPHGLPHQNQASTSAVRPSADIQAILTVLGRRAIRYESPNPPQSQILDLSNVDLRGADLGQARLQYSLLYGSDLTGVSLDQALLNNSHMDRAILRNAHLSQTNFSGAAVYGADFSGAYCRDAINLPSQQKIDATGHCQ
jgi:hypothetical protein